MARNQRKATTYRKKKTPLLRKGALGLLIGLSAFVVLMVILAPWNPTRLTAVSVSGTDVAEAGTVIYTTDIRVTEVMSSNRSAFPDENGSYPDWIELTNVGESTLSLEGFGLSDRSDKIRFTFP